MGSSLLIAKESRLSREDLLLSLKLASRLQKNCGASATTVKNGMLCPRLLTWIRFQISGIAP